MILAPLRGVTIRCFREVYAKEIRGAGFTEAITPFITSNVGYDPLKDRELKDGPESGGIRITPQFIGKDPSAFRYCLKRIKAAGYDTADLNCGCPFPMVRNKGRGSGILRTPDILRAMIETGCTIMGEGKFSIKARLGVEDKDELLALMPMLNLFPLRFLTVHARTAKQMYEGECDREAYDRIAEVAEIPLVYNGDAVLEQKSKSVMIGRDFIRSLGERRTARSRLLDYIEASERELSGDRPVLGRIKELVAYWKDIPAWRARWEMLKMARSVAELKSII